VADFQGKVPSQAGQGYCVNKAAVEMEAYNVAKTRGLERSVS
jgi:hypothetical protein